MSQNQIEHLVSFQFTPDPNETERPFCVVCRAHCQDGDLIRVLPCWHEFHLSCVDPWLLVNRTCPVCRRDASI
ncbi:hypothetical protein HPB48_014289 [Haemaphysalis longicornis]|uniref:RING-type domain-containing protein n=1 Tax=Haemaphysalis longicornis TaxID=44386 RepID=A0A9J6FKJ6_HAELO|nr:hypothetical protein HPB48_014289 [Haemaphysalis longicornis]